MKRPIHIAELLTPRNLKASRDSEICPACGKVKAAGQAVCPACRRQLPRYIQSALLTAIEDRYEHGMLRALKRLKAPTFILPDSPQVTRTERLKVFDPRQLRPTQLVLSRASAVCPKCCETKPAGAPFCGRCAQQIVSALMRIHGGRRSLKGPAAEALIERLFNRLTDTHLTHDPKDYAAALVEALRLVKTRTLCMPQE